MFFRATSRLIESFDLRSALATSLVVNNFNLFPSGSTLGGFNRARPVDKKKRTVKVNSLFMVVSLNRGAESPENSATVLTYACCCLFGKHYETVSRIKPSARRSVVRSQESELISAESHVMFAVLSQLDFPSGKAFLDDVLVKLLPLHEWRYVEA